MARSEHSERDGLGDLRALRRAVTRGGLLFGTIAIMFVLTVGSGLGDRDRRIAEYGLDTTMTGSIDATNRYTVRRSVLQAPGASPCLYFPDGSRRGDC